MDGLVRTSPTSKLYLMSKSSLTQNSVADATIHNLFEVEELETRLETVVWGEGEPEATIDPSDGGSIEVGYTWHFGS